MIRDPSLTILFGAIHHRIRLRKHLLIGAFGSHLHHAEAARDCYRTVERKICDRGLDAIQQEHRVLQRYIWQKQNELVPTPARDRVRIAQLRLHERRNLLERDVTHRVSIAIIDVL